MDFNRGTEKNRGISFNQKSDKERLMEIESSRDFRKKKKTIFHMVCQGENGNLHFQRFEISQLTWPML